MLKRLLIFVVLLAAVVHADGPDLRRWVLDVDYAEVAP